MKVVVVVDPSVRLVGQYPVTYRYTCSLCGKEWDGPPPTCGADGVCLVTMVFCSEDCRGRGRAGGGQRQGQIRGRGRGGAGAGQGRAVAGSGRVE